MNKKCNGCGSILQSTNENLLGYVPIEKLLLENTILCKRCFRLKHYGVNDQDSLPSEFYKEEVMKAINKSDIVLVVVDVFDLESSLSKEILDIMRDKKHILVINKTDLLPRNIVKNKLIKGIYDRLECDSIVPNDVAYISAKSVEGINGIIRKIEFFARLRKNKKYTASIIGVSNTGKSSIVNKIIDKFNIKTESTVSKYSGTTIKNIPMKIKTSNMDLTLYDTPGLIPNGRIIEMLDKDTATYIVPQNRLISKQYNLKNKEAIVITKYIIMEKISKNVDRNDREYATSFKIYASPNVKLHKTRMEKYNELKNTPFYNMTSNEEIITEEFDTREIEFPQDYELAILGLGIITTSHTVKLKITYPKGLKIILRPGVLITKK